MIQRDGGLVLIPCITVDCQKTARLLNFLSEPGIRVKLQKTENYYLADQQREMPKVDAELYFHIDEKNNQLILQIKVLHMITRAVKTLISLFCRILVLNLLQLIMISD